MKDLIFTIEPETRKVTANKDFIGVSGENLQGDIIAGFKDNDFIDGTGYFEVIINENQYFLEMEKDAENKTYSLPITNSLLQQSGALTCQFVINQANDAKFKSQKFNIPVLTAINATKSVPPEYQDWVDQVTNSIKQLQFSYFTITLYANNWLNNEQVKNISVITPTSMIWLSAVQNRADISNYQNAGICITAQGNGTLTFNASSTPSADIQVNLIVNNAPNANIIQVDQTLIINASETIEQNENTLILN